MKTPDIRVPLILLIVIITLLAFCKSAPAAPLNAEQRALVTGLTANNKELTAKVSTMEAQVAADAAKQVFAAQKIESLQANLKTSKANEEKQLQDLLTQQKKIEVLDAWAKAQWQRAEDNDAIAKKKTLEAHKNAQERDIFVVAFAILASTAACYALFPVINKVLNVTFPWTLAWIVAWGFLVGVFYGMERFALRYLINHL